MALLLYSVGKNWLAQELAMRRQLSRVLGAYQERMEIRNNEWR